MPIGSAALAVTDLGAGHPIVFLHAGVADQRSWLGVVDALPRHLGMVRSVLYDRRGFGESTWVEETHSWVNDLVALLDLLELEKAILVGNSQGGRIALDAALVEPERVEALVLIGAAVTGAPAPQRPVSAVTALVREIDAAEESGQLEQVNELEAQLWLDGPSQRAGRVKGSARELFLDMNSRALHAHPTGSGSVDSNAWNRLAEISVPTLALVGEFDLPHLVEQSRQLALTMRACEFEILEAMAHLPGLEGPERTAARIAQFLHPIIGQPVSL